MSMNFDGNILFFFCNAIAPEKGGIERWCASMCPEFESRGNNVVYLAAKPVWKEFADPQRQTFLPNPRKLNCAENASFFKKLLLEKNIRIILYLWADGKRFPFAREAQKFNVPVIAAIHTDPCFYKQRLRGKTILMRIKRFLRFRRQSKIYRANAKVCAATILLSESFIPGFLSHFPGTASPRVFAIPNPSSYARTPIDFSPKKKELLFVGRMEMRVKQPQLLLDIWRTIQDLFPEWNLRFVGGGFDFDSVKTYSNNIGAKRVLFEGFQDPAPFYRSASIFCMTSAYEGFPNVLIEAASFACVPVAFDSFAAIHDIITDGENGLIVPAFNLDTYAEKLALLMQNDSLRERLAKNASTQIPEKFSPQKIGALWEQILSIPIREKD